MRSTLLLIILILASVASASEPWPYGSNSFAIYRSDDGPGDGEWYYCSTAWNNSVVTFDVAVWYPFNPDFGGVERAVQRISGFECRLDLPAYMTVLGWSFPTPAINVGSGAEAVVGFGQPLDVVADITVLASVQIRIADPDLTPAEVEPFYHCREDRNVVIRFIPLLTRASIPGEIAFVDADDADDPLVAGAVNSGADLLMAIYPEVVVGTARESWGAVKALYR